MGAQTCPSKDGGQAFPHILYNSNADPIGYDNGMTIRDYFAGQALAGMFAAPQPPDFNSFEDSLSYYARVSYHYADAMLAERQTAHSKGELKC
jgi:hypothetical protein